jgi:hypothetical protein
MLLEKFPPMIGAALPNRLGGAHGRNYQHGRASRGFVSAGGTRQAIQGDAIKKAMKRPGLCQTRRQTMSAGPCDGLFAVTADRLPSKIVVAISKHRNHD